MVTISCDKTKCTKDNLCLKVCGMGNIVEGPDGFPQAGNNCILCGHCQAVCPHGALTLNNVAPDDLEKTSQTKISLKNLSGLIKSRRSIREYKPEPIPAKTLDKLIDITRWAPTGGNSQLVEWLVADKPEVLKEISRLVIEWSKTVPQLSFLSASWDGGYDVILRGAPDLAIAHAGNAYGSTAADCVIAATTLELLASSQDLGCCWAGFFMMAAQYPPLREYLRIPEGHNIHAALMLGYPKYQYRSIPTRKPARIKRL